MNSSFSLFIFRIAVVTAVLRLSASSFDSIPTRQSISNSGSQSNCPDMTLENPCYCHLARVSRSSNSRWRHKIEMVLHFLHSTIKNTTQTLFIVEDVDVGSVPTAHHRYVRCVPDADGIRWELGKRTDLGVSKDQSGDQSWHEYTKYGAKYECISTYILTIMELIKRIQHISNDVSSDDYFTTKLQQVATKLSLKNKLLSQRLLCPLRSKFHSSSAWNIVMLHLDNLELNLPNHDHSYKLLTVRVLKQLEVYLKYMKSTLD